MSRRIRAVIRAARSRKAIAAAEMAVRWAARRAAASQTGSDGAAQLSALRRQWR